MNSPLDEEINRLIEAARQKSPEQVIEESRTCFPKIQYQDRESADSAVLIMDRYVLSNPPGNADDNRSYCVFQIHHTNLGKLSSRSHLMPIDNDLRRPMFMSSSDNANLQTQWFRKNVHLFLAYENVTTDRVLDNWIIFKQYFGQSQSVLHYFHGWCAHVLGHPAASWCMAEIKILDDSNAQVVLGKVPSSDEFTALVKGEMTKEQCGFMPIPEDWKEAAFTGTGGQRIPVTPDESRAHNVKLYQEELLKSYSGSKH